GIATALLNGGFGVTLLDVNADALARGAQAIAGNLDGLVARGRIDREERDRRLGSLAVGSDFALLKDADLIIEAVFEKMDVKKEIFRRLDAVAKPGAVLATNTSYLSVETLAHETVRPRDVI